MGIEKAFDEVWHERLLYTTGTLLPRWMHNLLASYLSDRTFIIKINDEYSKIKEIKAGVLQGNVFGPILYTFYTADIPTTKDNKILTFAVDNTILATHSDPAVAVILLQEHVTKIEKS